MKIFNLTSLIVLSVLALLSAVSCSNGCEETRDSMCGLSFVSTSGNEMMQMSLYSLRKSYVLNGKEQVFPDSTFRILNSRAKMQELRLDPNDKHTRFAMYMIYQSFGDNYAISDTLDIWYTPETHYLDIECGCTVYFNIDSIRSTHNLITTANVKNNVVSNSSSQINIELEY